MSRTIGIDLGTTNCCVTVLDNGKPVVVPTKEGRRVMPSVVSINERGERLVGTLAKRQMRLNPEHTAYAVKRLMGRKFNDPQVQQAKPYLPYQIEAAQNGDVRVNLRGQAYSPAEISGMILAQLRDYAKEHLEEDITDAIITVPAYFDDSQRQATKDAGRLAGLEVKRIINEPTAAALAYGVDMKEGKRLIVYDLGGGTFDVTVLQVSEGVFEVLATSGDTFLGGHDFDQAIVEWMIDAFQKAHGVDLRQDRIALQRLVEEAEKAKCDLSSVEEVELQMPFLHTKENGETLHFQAKLTRAQLEKLTADLVQRTEAPCLDALKQAGLQPRDIDEVLLVGGQTRMPKVIEKVTQIFGKAPNASLSPDEVVAFGASLQGGILKGDVKDIVLLDVTPLTLSLETQGGLCVPMIPRNAPIPTKKTRVFTTVRDNQNSVEIHVLQGESQLANVNRSLGRFDLTSIPPAPRGLPEIEVNFAIDANGIVNVSAVDKATGKSQQIIVQPSSGLTHEEIERILKRGEEYKEEETRRVEIVQIRNRLQGLLYQTRRSYDEFKDLLSKGQAEEVIELFKRAERAAQEGTAEDCAQIQNELMDIQKMLSRVTMM